MNRSNYLMPYNYRYPEPNSGGGCCAPRRCNSYNDVNNFRYAASSPRDPCTPYNSQNCLVVEPAPMVGYCPCPRPVSMVPAYNTSWWSSRTYNTPLNYTPNASQTVLMVPKVMNRSRSVSTLEDSLYDDGPLSSTRIDSSRSHSSPRNSCCSVSKIS